MKKALDLSAYLVIGPENTRSRPVEAIVKSAVKAGFTCVQIRSKTASARELIELARRAAEAIADAGKAARTTLLVDDRLDVVLAARKQGIAVDGIHVGQSDIPAEVCREYLGEDAVVGLSAPAHELLGYVATADVRGIDYFGVGPLHETKTKPDCGLNTDGKIVTRSLSAIAELARMSPVPIVVGGGVKLADLPGLAESGAAGFFVVSAVCEADDPGLEAAKMVNSWRSAKHAG